MTVNLAPNSYKYGPPFPQGWDKYLPNDGKWPALIYNMLNSAPTPAPPVSGTFTVNASVAGSGGTVTPATQLINLGSSAMITISPTSGYKIATILDNGVSQTVAGSYTIPSVTANHNIIVAFTPTTVATKATLTASYSSYIVTFSFTGFQPNELVTLTMSDGTVQYAVADSNGADTGDQFGTEAAAGSYTLVATDAYGHSAKASFTIPTSGGGGGSTGTPILTVSYANYTVTYNLSGFNPNVTITLTYNGNTVYDETNSSGAISGGYFWDYDPSGTYTLTATDGVHTKSATFKI